ncbi:hypothetical protein MTR_5g035500 [Medicago truncatula]|uniref:Uncharacterized protein n=1 Tax=Medicago truncatula TaxID=3880 RepID=G7K457_MEDTR|nr:hypothetical protein MTR_5g035500 [Medicago truncatula]
MSNSYVELLTFKQRILLYQWLEDSLKSAQKLSEDLSVLKLDPQVEGIDEYLVSSNCVQL